MAETERQATPHVLSAKRSRQLSARHKRARAFAWICGAATWVGVLMLAVLLLDVFTDASGWIYQRIDRDPRMFLLQLNRDSEFRARAGAEDPALFKALDRKISAKERRAQQHGEALSQSELTELSLDFFHSKVSRNEDYFDRFKMRPTLNERLAVLGSIVSDLINSYPSRHPTKAGLKSALVGTIWLLVLTALIAIPLGISAAIYLEEYAARNSFNRFIEVNIANLAGVPSIVYGILGLAIFVRSLSLGRSVLAGAATMSLLILPVIIIAAREALKAVPDSIRQGAHALGATRWQVTRHHVLPAALPGILTGVILAMSRAIGETAPMIMIGALSYVAFVPRGPLDDFTVLPIQIFNWVAMPQREFHMLGACGILVLLGLLLVMNSVAIYIRHRAQRSIKW
jgi:phosphate transport system permease protein